MLEALLLEQSPVPTPVCFQPSPVSGLKASPSTSTQVETVTVGTSLQREPEKLRAYSGVPPWPRSQTGHRKASSGGKFRVRYVSGQMPVLAEVSLGQSACPRVPTGARPGKCGGRGRGVAGVVGVLGSGEKHST